MKIPVSMHRIRVMMSLNNEYACASFFIKRFDDHQEKLNNDSSDARRSAVMPFPFPQVNLKCE
jgi:hypothetical protein